MQLGQEQEMRTTGNLRPASINNGCRLLIEATSHSSRVTYIDLRLVAILAYLDHFFGQHLNPSFGRSDTIAIFGVTLVIHVDQFYVGILIAKDIPQAAAFDHYYYSHFISPFSLSARFWAAVSDPYTRITPLAPR